VKLKALDQRLAIAQNHAQKDSIQKAIDICNRELDPYTQRVEVRFHVSGDVKFPGNSVEFARGNDTLAGLIELSLPETLSKTVSPIKDKVEALVSSIDTVVNSLNDVFDNKTKNDLKGSIAAIKPTVENIEQATATLNSFVTNETGRMH